MLPINAQRRHFSGRPMPRNEEDSGWYALVTETLVTAAKALSSARDMSSVTAIVRQVARHLAKADGATFVLRDGQQCHYVDEDAIKPLWKGQRFPMSICISGWVMLNGKSVVIENVFADPRIPGDVYRKTFVKSMAMVPIRPADPIGAIGAYWASGHVPSREEMWALQSLADIAALAMENVRLYSLLEEKLGILEDSNRELSRFAWMISSALKEPLKAIDKAALYLEEDNRLHDEAANHARTMRYRIDRMKKKLDDLLNYARLESHMEKAEEEEELSGDEILRETLATLSVPAGFTVSSEGDIQRMRVQRMPLQQILAHLIDNAVKHHNRANGQVIVGVHDERVAYRIAVIDDGPGIPEDRRASLFDMTGEEDAMPGSGGMGLTLVRKMLLGYGGDIRFEAVDGGGSAFVFTWPKPLTEMMRKDKKEIWA